jgi:hypothetical protein
LVVAGLHHWGWCGQGVEKIEVKCCPEFRLTIRSRRLAPAAILNTLCWQSCVIMKWVLPTRKRLSSSVSRPVGARCWATQQQAGLAGRHHSSQADLNPLLASWTWVRGCSDASYSSPASRLVSRSPTWGGGQIGRLTTQSTGLAGATKSNGYGVRDGTQKRGPVRAGYFGGVSWPEVRKQDL